MARLNYHHLFYFWRVAKGAKLTEVARELHISQSALSIQISQLEESLGQKLFRREGRRLHLTEAGHVALAYAEDIFGKGEELAVVMRDRQLEQSRMLRIGLVATLSRNFVDGFIRPLLGREDLRLSLRSRGLQGLLEELSRHRLDLVLSNAPVSGNEEFPWRCQRIAQQAVSIVGHPEVHREYRGPQDLEQYPVIVPGPHSEIRTGFELQCERWQIKPRIVAEVDDMAMLRLVARDTQALAVLPPVTVRDEIANGRLLVLDHLPQVQENFYAISIRRQFEHPVFSELLSRGEDEIFETVERDQSGLV
ncbi:LysR family transcriptional regulator [Proteobacteria bacterium 005FR1]|nr:LysR family transcriptional regulator [Proteobacteria bacterium 005FR1]